MRILFIHQNFPGQFRHVASALSDAGHEVVGLGTQNRRLAGVRVVNYPVNAPERVSDVNAVRDFEVKVIRGLACAAAMAELNSTGFRPDVIVAHPGWGECLFCKEIWPDARLLVFAEFFYRAEGSDFGFDAEFIDTAPEAKMKLRLKNSALLHAFHAADGGYAPTRWQHSQIPGEYRDRFAIAFDGIDTRLAAPNANACLKLARDNVLLQTGDEVLTFVSRNLEPYRGFHVLMRALPEILRRRPRARALIIGGDEVSYGSKPSGGGTWRSQMLAEVGTRLPFDRVHFLGRIPYSDYLRVLQVSACHVYLTYPFVLSWSCVEALSMGCAVIASKTPPVEEVIDHERNGLLVDFFDVRELTNRVCDVLANPAGFKAMRAEARRGAVESFDLKTVCLPRLIQLISERATP